MCKLLAPIASFYGLALYGGVWASLVADAEALIVNDNSADVKLQGARHVS